MKTVNYFGIALEVPDEAKYIAMDGVHENYQVYWYNQKPVFSAGRKLWKHDSNSSERGKFEYGYLSEGVRITKPRKSLMKLGD